LIRQQYACGKSAQTACICARCRARSARIWQTDA
jgi:hypothetical protein